MQISPNVIILLFWFVVTSAKLSHFLLVHLKLWQEAPVKLGHSVPLIPRDGDITELITGITRITDSLAIRLKHVWQFAILNLLTVVAV